MKKIKRNLGIFFVAFALCMAFAVTTKVEAAEVTTKIGVVNNQKNMATLMGIPDFAVSYISSDKSTAGVSIAYAYDGQWTRIGIFDSKDRLIATKDALSYATISGLQKNKVYYYRAQTISGNGGVATSGWSSPKAFSTLMDTKVKLQAVKGKRACTLKLPKLTGLKNYTVYISKKSDTGFKKVKTVKPGKKIKITKYKKKSFKLGQTYYFKITQKTSKNITCANYFKGYVYFYRTFQ